MPAVGTSGVTMTASPCRAPGMAAVVVTPVLAEVEAWFQVMVAEPMVRKVRRALADISGMDWKVWARKCAERQLGAAPRLIHLRVGELHARVLVELDDLPLRRIPSCC